MTTAQLAVKRACDDPKVKTQANLARLVGEAVRRRVAPAMVQQWLDGRRPVNPKYCPAIESLTERRVRVWELRPDDWHLIWPDCIGAEGAPHAPAANESQAREAA